MRNNTVKILKLMTLSCLFGFSATQAGTGERYVIDGDFSAVYKSGEIVIYSPEKKSAKATGMKAAGMSAVSNMSAAKPAQKTGGKAVSMSSAKPAVGNMSAAKPVKKKPAKKTEGKAVSMSMGGGMSMGPAVTPGGSLKDSLNIVAEAKLIDGKFRIEGKLDKVQRVYFYVLDGLTEDGGRMAPIKGQGFILEPGKLTMTMNNRAKFVVHDGKYNDAVYNVWKESKEYKDTVALKNKLYTEVAGEAEQEKRTRLDKAADAQSLLFELETNGRKKTALTHPDVLARKLAIQTAWLGGPWMLEAVYDIQKMAPEDEWANAYITKQEAYYAKRERNEQIARVGSGIRDFDAKTLAGDTMSLKKVRSENKYVLLEFWASWCGPCRSEIPHMKKAYAQYHNKGFEIFSFTIDDDKEAWQTASNEEELPWIDTGFGSESEPQKLYEVTGVPANYLVDGETGEVIARNLRGHKLDEKLEELLD